MVRNSPNGILIETNSLFDSIKYGKGLTLIHITPNIEKIIQTGKILASGGCLGASLYATPLTKDDTLHNLSEFLLNYELPKSIGKDKQAKTKIMAIKLPQSNFKSNKTRIKGIDYLKIGKQNYEIFNEFEKSFMKNEEIKEIKEEIVNQIARTKSFIDLCYDYTLEDANQKYFEKQLYFALQTCPLLCYALFETLQEYILLYQDDLESKKHKEINQFYNANFKKMIFDLCPEILNSFNLTKFNPKLCEIEKYLEIKSKKQEIFNTFDKEEFYAFVKWRLAQTIRFKILDSQKISNILTYENIAKECPSIIGHISYRLLRNSENSKNTNYYKYECFRAKKLWNFWNKEDIIIPFNSILPKGEVGINPSHPSLNYTIHLAKFNEKTRKVVLGKLLPIKLVPTLINHNKCNLRAKSE